LAAFGHKWSGREGGAGPGDTTGGQLATNPPPPGTQPSPQHIRLLGGGMEMGNRIPGDENTKRGHTVDCGGGGGGVGGAQPEPEGRPTQPPRHPRRWRHSPRGTKGQDRLKKRFLKKFPGMRTPKQDTLG